MSAIPLPNVPDEVVKRLEAIRPRSAYSFRLVQSILRDNKMETASGWDLLIDKYKKLDYSKINSSNYIAVFDYIYSSSISASNSAVWVYDVPASDAVALIAKISTLINQRSVFRSSFPYPIDESVLIKAPYNGEFVGVDSDGSRVVVYSCSKRTFNSREPIDLSALSLIALQSLKGFDEIIGVKSGFLQAYDRVVICPSGRLEIHLDLCCNMSEEDMEQYRLYYVKLLKVFSKNVIGVPVTWLDYSRNFFPKIQSLYSSPDGEVISLEHTTSTKSVKGERMRGKGMDLRNENFHIEGMKSIASTDFFAIKKGWVSSSGGHVFSVSIPGKLPAAGSAFGTIRYVVVEGCIDFAEFKMAVSKVL